MVHESLVAFPGAVIAAESTTSRFTVLEDGRANVRLDPASGRVHFWTCDGPRVPWHAFTVEGPHERVSSFER
jgi:hypothetical protein